MTLSPTHHTRKPIATPARRAIKWSLTVLVLGALAAFFIMPLNSCIEGCDCDEEIVEAIVEYGEPDQENRTVEDKQFTAEYIFYDAEIKKTFVWGKDVDICCLESSERYVPEDENTDEDADEDGDVPDEGDDIDDGDTTPPDGDGGDEGDGNIPPIAISPDPDSLKIESGETLPFNLNGEDPDGNDNDLTFDADESAVDYGDLICNIQGRCLYNHDTTTDNNITDTFTFTVTDIEGAESDPATVTITVGDPLIDISSLAGGNSTPVAEAQVAEAKPGEEIVIELKGVDRSPDSETVVQDVMALGVSVLREGLTYYLETLPEQGQISYPSGVSEANLPYQLSDRFVEYTAPEPFTEYDSFEFSVSDDDGDVENRSIAKPVTIQPAE